MSLKQFHHFVCGVSLGLITSALILDAVAHADDCHPDQGPSIVVENDQTNLASKSGILLSSNADDNADTLLIGAPLHQASGASVGAIKRHSLSDGSVVTLSSPFSNQSNGEFGAQILELDSERVAISAPLVGKGLVAVFEKSTLLSFSEGVIPAGSWTAVYELQSPLVGQKLGTTMEKVNQNGKTYILASAPEQASIHKPSVHVLELNGDSLNHVSVLEPQVNENTGLGTSILSLGDIDGDNLTELAISSPNGEQNEEHCGYEVGFVEIVELQSNGELGRQDQECDPALFDEDLDYGRGSHFGSSIAAVGEDYIAIGAQYSKGPDSEENIRPAMGRVNIFKKQNGSFIHQEGLQLFPSRDSESSGSQNKRYGSSLAHAARENSDYLQVGGSGTATANEEGQVITYKINFEDPSNAYELISQHTGGEALGACEENNLENLRYGAAAVRASMPIEQGDLAESAIMTFTNQSGVDSASNIKGFVALDRLESEGGILQALGGSGNAVDCGFESYMDEIQGQSVSVLGSLNKGSAAGSFAPKINNPWKLWVNPISGDNIVPVIVAFWGERTAPQRIAPNSDCFWELDLQNASESDRYTLLVPEAGGGEGGTGPNGARERLTLEFLNGENIPEGMLGQEQTVQVFITYYLRLSNGYMFNLNYTEVTKAFDVRIGE